MTVRCEMCGKVLMKSDGDTRIDGSIEIKCRDSKCGHVNIIKGNIADLHNASSS